MIEHQSINSIEGSSSGFLLTEKTELGPTMVSQAKETESPRFSPTTKDNAEQQQPTPPKDKQTPPKEKPEVTPKDKRKSPEDKAETAPKEKAEGNRSQMVSEPAENETWAGKRSDAAW